MLRVSNGQGVRLDALGRTARGAGLGVGAVNVGSDTVASSARGLRPTRLLSCRERATGCRRSAGGAQTWAGRVHHRRAAGFDMRAGGGAVGGVTRARVRWRPWGDAVRVQGCTPPGGSSPEGCGREGQYSADAALVTPMLALTSPDVPVDAVRYGASAAFAPHAVAPMSSRAATSSVWTHVQSSRAIIPSSDAGACSKRRPLTRHPTGRRTRASATAQSHGSVIDLRHLPAYFPERDVRNIP